MRLILIIFLQMLSHSLIAQTTISPLKVNETPKDKTESAQKQEQAPIENNFKIGPYNTKGEYIFFDRLEREKREAREEKAEENL